MSSAAQKINRPMRILQIASGDLWAGAEVQLDILCEELEADPEVELSVVLLNDGELAKRIRNRGTKLLVLDESNLGFLQICSGILRYCRQIRPDLIHSNRQKENVLAGLCRCVSGIPSIRTVHGAPEFNYSKWSAKYIVAVLDRLVGRWLQQRVVAVSEDLGEKLERLFPRRHIQVIKNGLREVSLARHAPEVDPEVKNIGIVGRLVPVKRHDLFLAMAKNLVDSSGGDEQYRFWVIGDGPLLADMRALATEQGIAGAVRFVGHVPDAEPYISALDVLVMCSDHEGTPMTLLEAWRSQVPVVAHDVGGLRELLNGGCGMPVSDDSAMSYAEAVRQLLSDDSMRDQCIDNATSKLRREYSAKGNKAAYLGLYRQVLG